MDFPLFSQIPNAVLNKFGPDELGLKKRKRKKSVKFQDEPDSSESKFPKPSQAGHDICTGASNDEDDEIKILDTPIVPSSTPILLENQNIDHLARSNKLSLVDCSKKKLYQPSDDEKSTADAIIQADTSPEKKTVACQTDESFLQMPPQELYEMYKDQIQAVSLQACRPLPLIKRFGCEPPLKLGLTKPKGKKRRVFYPGEND